MTSKKSFLPINFLLVIIWSNVKIANGVRFLTTFVVIICKSLLLVLKVSIFVKFLKKARTDPPSWFGEWMGEFVGVRCGFFICQKKVL